MAAGPTTSGSRPNSRLIVYILVVLTELRILFLDWTAGLTSPRHWKNFTGFLFVNVSPSKSPPSCTVYFTAIWLSLSTTTPPSVVFVQRPPEPPPPYGQLGLYSAIARSQLQHSPPGTFSHRSSHRLASSLPKAAENIIFVRTGF